MPNVANDICKVISNFHCREISKFDFENPYWTNRNGHFVQMVFPETNRFGIGISYIKGGDDYYAVALYHSGVHTKRPAINRPPEGMMVSHCGKIHALSTDFPKSQLFLYTFLWRSSGFLH